MSAIDRVAFYCTANAGYVVPSLVALASLRRLHPGHGFFLVADRDRLAPGQADRIAAQGVELIHFGGTDPFADEAHLTRECYWKFAGPGLFLDRGFRYSVVVDGDTLCVRNLDLDALLPRVECYAGIERRGSPRRWSFRYPDWVAKRYGLGPGAMDGDFTNTGVLVWNNRRVVELGVFDRAVACYRECSRIHPRMFRVGDQSLFALVAELEPRLPWLVLPSEYNFRVNSEGERRRLRDPAAIRLIHYTGPKPWRPDRLIDCVRNADKPAFRHRLWFKARWTQFVERHTPFWRDLSPKDVSGPARRLTRWARNAVRDLAESLILSGTSVVSWSRRLFGTPLGPGDTGWRRC